MNKQDMKIIAGMATAQELYDALLEKLGIKEEFEAYGRFCRLEGNEILIYGDTSYHGSPDYEIVNRIQLGPNQAGALEMLMNDEFKKLIRKASCELEKQRLEAEIATSQRALEYCNSVLQE